MAQDGIVSGALQSMFYSVKMPTEPFDAGKNEGVEMCEV